MTTMERDAMPTPWVAAESASHTEDPLLGCLLLLLRMEGLPQSADALRAGLPLVDNRFTPTLLIRAAQRAGLSARILRRPLRRISNLVLPAVLLLHDEQACVLKAIDPDRNVVQVLQPEAGGGAHEVALDDLQASYTGYAIFARRRAQFDARAETDGLARPRHWFWGTLWRSWRIYRDVLVASFLVNMFALASPLFIMNVYDRVVPNNAVETLWVLGIGVAAVYAFDLLMRGLRVWFIEMAGRKADMALSAMIYERVLGLRMAARPASVGAFANNLGEFESLRSFITSATMSTFVDLPFVIMFLVVIWIIAGPLVWVPLLAIPVIVGYGLLVRVPLRHAVEQVQRGASIRSATLVESLVGAESIKALGAESPMQRHLEEATAHIAKWSVRSRLLSASAVTLAVFLQQLALVGTVIYGVYRISDGLLSMGGLIAGVILTGRAIAPMAQVANLAAHFHQAQGSLRTLNHIMTLPTERESGRSYVSHPVMAGRIELDAVNFTFPGAARPSILGASARIEPGEHVGILGRTGSGKTTLLKLMLQLYEPAQGNIRIDGIEARQLDPAELHRNIGYVPQDVVLFFGTLRDNITFGTPLVEDEQLLRAARLAGVNQIADQHPLAYDLPIGERGAGLSGGQRQSVAIARALLLDPPVLMMDEPTAGMDGQTERVLKASLASAMEGHTLIIATHRTALLDLVQRLIVLEQGRIIADGPKDQVLENLRLGRINVAGT